MKKENQKVPYLRMKLKQKGGGGGRVAKSLQRIKYDVLANVITVWVWAKYFSH